MTSFKLFSFFSGVGFLDIGFEDEGFDIAFVNEYHAPFMDAYQYSRRKLGTPEPRYGFHLGSVTDFVAEELGGTLADYVSHAREDGSLVGFIGGPPCPDFSVGGKNRGREGSNGRLSRSYIDLIIEQQPDFFLFENVKGLWKTKRHRAFYDELLADLHASGYQTTNRVINAIEYGAPQDRERVILIGFRERSFLERGGLANRFDWGAAKAYPGRSAFEYGWPEQSSFEADVDIPIPAGLPIKLTVEYWFRTNAVETHANAQHVFLARAGLARFESVDEGDVSKKSYKRLHRWRYSPTAAYGNNEVHLHPYKARRISAAEALAIQSLPREFELPPTMTLSNMFKCIGNGVPFLAARGLAIALRTFLEQQDYAHHRIGYRSRNRQVVAEPGL